MHPKPTLKDRVKANLQAGLGMRKIPPEEGTAHLNAVGLPDANSNAWTAASLAAFMAEHDIRPERVPDLSHLRPWNEGRSWTDPERILRAIERGSDEEQGELQRLIKEDAAVRRVVIDLCADMGPNQYWYDPGIYARWLAFARGERPTPDRED